MADSNPPFHNRISGNSGTSLGSARGTSMQMTSQTPALGLPVGKADDLVASVGQQIKSLAGTLRQNPTSNALLGPATTTVADRLEAGGDFLQKEGLTGLANATVACVRRHPVETVLFGLGVGLLVSRVFGSRR